MKSFFVVAAIAAASFASTAWADIQTKPVSFKKGESSATIKGRLKGDQTIDYSLRAKAGQTMSVDMKTSNAAAYFNVLPPGSTGEAIFIGSTSGDTWTGTLPADGEYKVRTYLMRSAARRNEVANFTLNVAITGASHGGAVAPAVPAAGQASGNIPCAQAKGQPMGQCPFTVQREGQGSAMLTVTLPDGRKRVLFFEKGKATGADLSQADGDMTFKATKEADLFKIRAGHERYEVPEAAVFGG